MIPAFNVPNGKPGQEKIKTIPKSEFFAAETEENSEISKREIVAILEKLHEKFLMDNILREPPFNFIYGDEIESDEAKVAEAQQYFVDAIHSFLPKGISDAEKQRVTQYILEKEENSIRERFKTGVTIDEMVAEINYKNFDPEVFALGISMELLPIAVKGIETEDKMDEIVEELIENKLSDNILNRGALKLFVRGKVMETVGDLALLNKRAQESGNSKYQAIMNEILNVSRSLEEVRENTRKERTKKTTTNPKLIPSIETESKPPKVENSREIANLQSQINTLQRYSSKLSKESQKMEKEVLRLNSGWRYYNPFSNKESIMRQIENNTRQIKENDAMIEKLKGQLKSLQ